MRSGCWEDEICLVSNGILEELKREIRYARLEDNWGQLKRR